MGLFDPPTASIMKRMPPEVRMSLANVQAYAEDAIPSHLGRTKHVACVAMVMGAWVNAHNRFGTISIRAKDARYIQAMYENCARIARSDCEYALDAISGLFQARLMPEELTRAIDG